MNQKPDFQIWKIPLLIHSLNTRWKSLQKNQTSHLSRTQTKTQNHHLFTPLISLASLPFSSSMISSVAPISSPTISQTLQTDSSLSQPRNLLYLTQLGIIGLISGGVVAVDGVELGFGFAMWVLIFYIWGLRVLIFWFEALRVVGRSTLVGVVCLWLGFGD